MAWVAMLRHATSHNQVWYFLEVERGPWEQGWCFVGMVNPPLGHCGLVVRLPVRMPDFLTLSVSSAVKREVQIYMDKTIWECAL